MSRPTDLMRTEQKRQECKARARASIMKYMELRGITQDDLARKQAVTKRTIQNRIDDPGKMQLQDIWEMAIILKCPVGELCGGEMPEELIGRWIAEASKQLKEKEN